MKKEIVRKQKFEGIVVSTKMAKTAVVRVDSTTYHPKYHKQYKTSKKFKAHDEQGSFQVGDKVLIEACRPMSKDKKWRVVKKI